MRRLTSRATVLNYQFFLLRSDRKERENKVCIRNSRSSFCVFPHTRSQAGPGSPLVFCQRRREIREKDASKAKLQKQGFWAMEWRGPFRVERAAAHSIQPLSSLQSPVSTPPLPGVGVAVVRLVPLQLQNRGGRKRPAFLVSCSLNAEVIASPAPPPSCSRRR